MGKEKEINSKEIKNAQVFVDSKYAHVIGESVLSLEEQKILLPDLMFSSNSAWYQIKLDKPSFDNQDTISVATEDNFPETAAEVDILQEPTEIVQHEPVEKDVPNKVEIATTISEEVIPSEAEKSPVEQQTTKEEDIVMPTFSNSEQIVEISSIEKIENNKTGLDLPAEESNTVENIAVSSGDDINAEIKEFEKLDVGFYTWLETMSMTGPKKPSTNIPPPPKSASEHKPEPIVGKPKIKSRKDTKSSVTPHKSIEESTQLGQDVISETLAALLASQGHKENAVKMYRKLAEKFPEKSTTFADLIKKIKL
ncbi:MAG: hypothetical protein M3Q56_10485 [Bacteroidota bacterium]|nr:hypothetical protein [Bacteroidota bacterium]